jgi:hypothetical protein
LGELFTKIWSDNGSETNCSTIATADLVILAVKKKKRKIQENIWKKI